MIKAVFLDYTGTMVREDDPYTKQLLKIFLTSSSLKDPVEALRVAGVAPSEAVMIGDSEISDVKCAQEVGIIPVLLDRKGTAKRTDIKVIHSLNEISF